MDHPESGVAVAHGIGDDADGQQIINLFQGPFLTLDLLMDRVEPFDAAFEIDTDSILSEVFADRFLKLGEEFLKLLAALGNRRLQLGVRRRLQISEGQVFQVAAHCTHAQPVGDGRINVERLSGDALLFFWRQIAQGAHVVQPVSQLDEHHAHVCDHGQQHLPDAFHLAHFGRDQVEATDLGYPFHQAGGVGTKLSRNLGEGNTRVFDDVVQKRGTECRRIEPQLGESMGYFKWVREIGVA